MTGQGKDRFARMIGHEARKIEKARGMDYRSVLRAGWLLGVGGWLFVVPVVAGAWIGSYMDGDGGGAFWTFTGIVLGLAVGGYNIWYSAFRRNGNGGNGG